METLSVKLEKSGRILIPAVWRKKLKLRPESHVILTLADDSITVIGTRDQAIDRAQARLRRYVPKGRVLSEELIADRKKEAAKEHNS